MIKIMRSLTGTLAVFSALTLLSANLSAQILSYSNDFGGGFTTLVPAGSSDDTGSLDTNIENGFDIDNFALYGPDTQWQNIGFSRMEHVTNDGLNGDSISDGAVRFNSFDANASGGLLQLDGTMAVGESYSLDTWVFNRNNSFVTFEVSLYNFTDDVLLAGSGNITLNGALQDTGDGLLESLSYTAQASDAGDILQVRWVQTAAFNTARDIYVDSVSLTAVPEPSHAALALGLTVLALMVYRRRGKD